MLLWRRCPGWRSSSPGGWTRPTCPAKPAAGCGRSSNRWGVVENEAKLVAGTKTLHHLLPDLVMPMDRAWTGKFFQLHPPEWQDPANQRRTFGRVYGQLSGVARQVQPGQHVTVQGWRTSRTKILDNALIGFSKTELGGEQVTAAAPVNQVTFEVPGYPPAKNEAKSMMSADHPHFGRVLRLLEAAYRACAQQGFASIGEGHLMVRRASRAWAGTRPTCSRAGGTARPGGRGPDGSSRQGSRTATSVVVTVWN